LKNDRVRLCYLCHLLYVIHVRIYIVYGRVTDASICLLRNTRTSHSPVVISRPEKTGDRSALIGTGTRFFRFNPQDDRKTIAGKLIMYAFREYNIVIDWLNSDRQIFPENYSIRLTDYDVFLFELQLALNLQRITVVKREDAT